MHHDEQGNILIIVLVFCTFIATAAIALLESSILQIKMVNNFHGKLLAQHRNESDVINLEQKLETAKDPRLLPNVKFLQFVPDTLHFSEKEGVDYYCIMKKIQAQDGSQSMIKSTVGIRHKTNQAENGKMFFNNINNDDNNNKNKITGFVTPMDNPDDVIFAEKYIEKLKTDQHLTRQILYKPITVRLSNGKWVSVVPLYIKDQKPNFVLSFFEIQNDKPYFDILLPFDHSHDLSLSALIAVDSMSKGYADLIYVADNKGNIWKVNIDNRFPARWKAFQSDPPFSFVDKIIIGRHPESKGLLLYVLGIKKGSARKELFALWDKNLLLDFHYFPFFSFSDLGKLSTFSLQQGVLLIQSDTHTNKIIDAFTGSVKYPKQRNSRLGRRSWWQSA
ncbi:MAG: hypothetical protein ACHQJ6_02915 [Candidatus Berkiellales bacterium]